MGIEGKRVMVLGLDGATLDLIKPWAEAGLLPTFSRLFREGSWGKLLSTIPPITPAAWSSAFTGKNPGKHGMYDFTTREHSSYNIFMTDARVRAEPSIWQLAGQSGKRVIVYNVPLTYPPERVNGIMISGMQTPVGASDASWPPEIQQELEQAVPGLNISGHGEFRPGHEAEWVRELLDINEQNFKAACYLMTRQPWDLFIMVFQNTDAMGHFMWKHMENKGAGLPEAVREIAANAMLDCYRDLDAKVARLIEEAGEDTEVLVMSDHGHGRLDYGFSVNIWLLEKGYIKFKRDPVTQFKYLLYRLGFTPDLAYRLASRLGTSKQVMHTTNRRATRAKRAAGQVFLSFLDIDWSRTRAFSEGSMGPIFINLKGREPNGIVEPGAEYEALLDQLCADLATIKEPGTNSPLFPEIHRGRDLYSGPLATSGPDLYFFPANWSYNATGRRQFEDRRALTPLGVNTGSIPSLLQMRMPFTGTHRMEGILFMMGPGVRRGGEISSASVVDVAPTVLALLGVPVPRDMDGKVLEAALSDELRGQLNVTFAEADGLKPDLKQVEEMSPEEQELLASRLRNLGYIG